MPTPMPITSAIQSLGRLRRTGITLRCGREMQRAVFRAVIVKDFDWKSQIRISYR